MLERRKSYSVALFLIAFFSVVAANGLKQCENVAHSQIVAESAANFFYNAFHQPLWKNLLKLDSDYLPLVPRIFATSVQLVGAPIAGIPAIYNWFCVLFGAALAATFVLPFFRSLILSDFARLVVSFLLGVGAHSYSDVLQNVAYSGAYLVLPLLLMTEAIEKLSLKRARALGIFLVIFPLSKLMYFLLLGPVGWILFQGWKKKSASILRVWGPFALASLCQLVLMVAFVIYRSSFAEATTKVSALKRLWMSFAYGANWVTWNWFGRLFEWENLDWASRGLAVLGAGIMILVIWKNRRNRALLWPVLVSLWATIVSVVLVMNARASWYPLAFGQFPSPSASTYVFSGVSQLFLALCFLNTVKYTSSKYSTLWILLGLGSFGAFAPSALSTRSGHALLSAPYSNWKAFSPFIAKDNQYFVPLDPYPALLQHGVEYLADVPNREEIAVPVEEIPAGIILAPSGSEGWAVHYLGVAFKSDVPVTPESSVQVFDKQGRQIGRGEILLPVQGKFAFFHFSSPPLGVASVEFSTGPRKMRPLGSKSPLWIWVGTKGPPPWPTSASPYRGTYWPTSSGK